MTEDRDDAIATQLRRLPQVDRVVEELQTGEPHALVVDAAQQVLQEARSEIMAGDPAPSSDEIRERILDQLAGRRLSMLMPVINATGVLLHTNLGRAPLHQDALSAITSIGSGYSNLEYDIAGARRGNRYVHASRLICEVTNAEAALVVNNNAAAVLLALSGLAKQREVIVSRGELIEIGGEFRIPEILAESGASMVEVGTTNRTHMRDYQAAISDRTAAILKVHPSNYRVVGFASAVASKELVELAQQRGLKMIHDIGSGLIRGKIAGFEPDWLRDEPTVVDAIREGADIVTFSGDKLLGGPQAGVLAGKAEAIGALRASSLLRAFRVDKTTLASLQATLSAYLSGSEGDLPIWRMALTPLGEIEDRARELAQSLNDTAAKIEIAGGFSTTGGGSGPGSRIPTALVEVAPRNVTPNELITRLLRNDPPVVARIESERVVIDLRTVLPQHDSLVRAAISAAL